MSTITDRGVVHCDLKAQNIMITFTSPRQVVYIDFAFSTLRVPRHRMDVHKNRYRSVALPTARLLDELEPRMSLSQSRLRLGLLRLGSPAQQVAASLHQRRCKADHSISETWRSSPWGCICQRRSSALDCVNMFLPGPTVHVCSMESNLSEAVH